MRESTLSQSYLAERGVIVKRDPSNYLIMSDGHIVRRADKAGAVDWFTDRGWGVLAGLSFGITDTTTFLDGCGILMPVKGGDPPIDEMGSKDVPV